MEWIKIFDKELSYIRDFKYVNFVLLVLCNTNDYHKIAPAASIRKGSKNHPSDERKKGGLVLHTKRVFRLLIDLLKTTQFELCDDEIDMLLVAAILHDMAKFPDGKSKKTNHNHADIMAKEIRELNTAITSESDRYRIARYVETHNGKWGKEKPATYFENLLHYADYIASRDYVKIKPLKEYYDSDK